MARRPTNRALERSSSIDRDSFEPAYAQLANILRQSVAAGVLRPGDQLPSESQLCQRYGVSPMTVRRAMNILVDQGVVTAEQGRGTFVKPVAMGAATFQLTELQNLFSDPAHTAVRLLETRIVTADERIARKLAIAIGQRTIYIRRLLCMDGVPAFYHREYLIYDPKRPIVESEMEVTALQHLFSGSGETILKCGDLSIEATILTAEEAGLLQAPQPLAAFCLEHLFYDFDDKPISWGWFIGRSDRLRFTTRVGPARG
ncbi:Mannosyl-D-glycerate transport/metabolism system repressor MngR [Thermoflexales bacterium]|nr:Mannosyl-D-glycerate transport/metabolism system repressor MngR [Thermoflexales bacterium]